MRILRSVAIDTARRIHDVGTAFFGRGKIRRRDRGGKRFWHVANQIFHGEYDFSFRERIADRWKRPEVNNHGSQVFIRQRGVALVGHKGEKGAAVMADAFADGARQLIVGPIPCSGFFVGCEVGGNDTAGQTHRGNQLRRSQGLDDGDGPERVQSCGV